MRKALLLLLVLPACSWFDGSTRLESSVILAAGGKATVHMRTPQPGPLSVELRGLGPGGVAFEAHGPVGVVIARGLLSAESRAECRTSEGNLTFTFEADAQGGSVGYVARSENGLAIDSPPQTR